MKMLSFPQSSNKSGWYEKYEPEWQKQVGDGVRQTQTLYNFLAITKLFILGWGEFRLEPFPV